MKYYLCFLSFFFSSMSAIGSEIPTYLSAQDSVIAPAVFGDISAGDRIIGQIYYDVTNGEFKGVNKSGTIDVLSVSGSNAITSDGEERAERARLINNGSTCTIDSQSGSWLASCTRNSTGNVTATFASNIFSTSPSCTCTAFDNSGVRLCESIGLTSSAYNLATVNISGTSADTTVDIICMGPR